MSQPNKDMRNYVIIEVSEIANIDFNQVLEANIDSLIYNVDGTQTIVKYEGGQPSFLWGKTEYTHEEILTILATDEWTSDEEI